MPILKHFNLIITIIKYLIIRHILPIISNVKEAYIAENTKKEFA